MMRDVVPLNENTRLYAQFDQRLMNLLISLLGSRLIARHYFAAIVRGLLSAG